MSTFGVVALSVLIGVFISLLIGASAYLIFVAWSFKKIVTETRATLTAHREQWATSLTGLSAILTQHRTETSHAISAINGQQIGEAVERFSQLIVNFGKVAQRSEAAAIAITTCTREWLASDTTDEEDDGSSTTGPGIPGIPSSYRPPSVGGSGIAGVGLDGYAVAAPGEHFIGRSKVAISDAEALLQEQTDHTQT
ncbi:MAG TPA: hypothetical protein VN861_03130 [Candidatus Acidoferrales bacterium]|nr:hypothetical protein [Candidatus Acidoferrales bacterium]